MKVNGPVALHIGEILQNSIRINEMIPSKDFASASYALIGAAKTSGGQSYIVRSIINRFSNELASIDVLYAFNKKIDCGGIKKQNQLGHNPQGSLPQGNFLSGSDAINIAELLDTVNKFFPDILPEGVLKHYGYEARPGGGLGESTLYQQCSGGLTDREMLDIAVSELNM